MFIIPTIIQILKNAQKSVIKKLEVAFTPFSFTLLLSRWQSRIKTKITKFKSLKISSKYWKAELDIQAHSCAECIYEFYSVSLPLG